MVTARRGSWYMAIGGLVACVLCACAAAVVVGMVRQNRQLAVDDRCKADLSALADDLLWFMPKYARRGAYNISGGHRVFVVQGVPNISIGTPGSVDSLIGQVRQRAQRHVDLLVATHDPVSGLGGTLTLRPESDWSFIEPKQIGGNPSVAPGSTSFANVRIMLVYDRGPARGIITLLVDQEPAYATLTIAEFPRP